MARLSNRPKFSNRRRSVNESDGLENEARHFAAPDRHTSRTCHVLTCILAFTFQALVEEEKRKQAQRLQVKEERPHRQVYIEERPQQKQREWRKKEEKTQREPLPQKASKVIDLMSDQHWGVRTVPKRWGC